MTKTFIVLILLSHFLLAQGKLCIIGGGKRPSEMVKRMITESGVDKSGYIVILPFASEEQDSSIFYARKQFEKQGITNIMGIVATVNQSISQSSLDSISNAPFIYMPGGDQVRFMNIVKSNGIELAIKKCFQKGGLIAGTSAGAAVMSEKMITGVELKYPNTTENSEKQGFETIESDNIEISKGLGFLKNAIVDQHFIKRKRQNRLIAVAIENPSYLCVGIDESTAILVKNGKAEVLGDSQVLTLKNMDKKSAMKKGKLSGKGLTLNLFIIGDTFKID
jgi:cyanophycinase